MNIVFDLSAHVQQSLLYEKVRQEEAAHKKKFLSPSLDPSLQALDSVITLLRSQGGYDAFQPVGERHLPWVHALAARHDLPLPMLGYLSQSAEVSGVFSLVQGKSVGGYMVDRFFEDIDHSLRDSVRWWMQNAPLDPMEASQWSARFTSMKETSAYNAGAFAQEMIEILSTRGVAPHAEAPHRPVERWSQKHAWWKSILAADRLDEPVFTPSGRLRPLKEWLHLSGLSNHKGFARTLIVLQGGTVEGYKNEKQHIVAEMPAPHGRRKELLEDWVLGRDTPLDERLKRLAASVRRTEGVLSELDDHVAGLRAKRRDLRPQLSELLAHRAPSGMSFAGWFELYRSHENYWPAALTDFMQERGIDPWVAPDGAGLLQQRFRSFYSVPREFGHGWDYDTAHAFSKKLDRKLPLSDEEKRRYAGDPSTHPGFVDDLVDALLCPSPEKEITRLARFALRYKLIDNPALHDKLYQAFYINLLKTVIKHRPSGTQASFTTEREKLHATNQACLQRAEQALGLAWQVSLTEQDMEALFNEWGLTEDLWSSVPGDTDKKAPRILQQLHSLGKRLSVEVLTGSLSPPSGSSPSPRPRL